MHLRFALSYQRHCTIKEIRAIGWRQAFHLINVIRGGCAIPSEYNSKGCRAISLICIAANEGHVDVIGVKYFEHCIRVVVGRVPVSEVVALMNFGVIEHCNRGVHGLIDPGIVWRHRVGCVDQYIILSGVGEYCDVHLRAKVGGGGLTGNLPPNTREL